MNVFTKIALASTGMVEIKRNQAGFILYIQGRANPPKLERFVTFWSFPRWSNILHPLTGGRRNHLTICQIRYKETNSEMVTLSSRGNPWWGDVISLHLSVFEAGFNEQPKSLYTATCESDHTVIMIFNSYHYHFFWLDWPSPPIIRWS